MAIFKPYVYRQKEIQGKIGVNTESKTSKKTKEKTNQDYASEIAKKYGLDTEKPTDVKARQKVKLPEIKKKETPEIARPQLKATPEGMNYGGRVAQDTSMPYATSQVKNVPGTLNLTQGQQTVKDIPRNLLAGIASAANVIGKVTGTSSEDEKKKLDRAKITNPLLRQGAVDRNKIAENLQSEVTEKTPLYAKMVRGALLSTPTSALTSAMGGGLASVVSGAVANPMVVELARDTPMFVNSYDDGLKEAEKMNLKGVDRQVYAVGQGLIETITERMSSYGLEAQFLGLGDAVGKGFKEGSKEFMKSIIEEGGSEGIATIAGQLLKGEYGSKQSLEADLEEIMVAIGTGGLMGGAGTIGSLSGGVTYETVGTDGDKVLVQTSDGRIEPVNPEILMRYKINESKRAYLTKNQTQEIVPEVKADTTVPVQEPTIVQGEFEPNKGISTPKELESVAEPLNEVAEETKKPKINVREMKSFDVMRYDQEGASTNAKDKPQGLYVSNTYGNKDYVSPHADEVDSNQKKGKVEPKNPLYVDDKMMKNYEGEGKGGRRGIFGQSAGISALEQLTTPIEYKSLLGMSKEETVSAYNERFPNVPLTEVLLSDKHDYLGILEAYAGQLAKEQGYDSIVQQPEFGIPSETDEIVVLNDDIIKWEDAPKTEQVSEVKKPEVTKLDEGVNDYYTQDSKLAFTDTDTYEANLEKAEKSIRKVLAKNSTFEVKRDGVIKFTVHESNKKNGKYQITYYDKKGEPLSDSQVDAQELVKEVLYNKIRPSEMIAPAIEPTQPSKDGTYTYQYKLRGFSPGAQPSGVISNNETDGKHGSITYDRPLTDKEISDYELEPKKVPTQMSVAEPEVEKASKVVSTIENLSVDNIGVDAKRFQFKEATDGKTGASKKLTGSDTFNQELAGVVTVWRDKSGKDWIVNGHHRLELAKRGKATNIDARILQESDGITESEARMVGARQNIAEGTPSIKDTAQIFKEANYTIDDLNKLGLKLKTEKIQQGYDVAQLNDRLWGNVVNKSLDEVQAAMIGSAFPKATEGNDAKQNAIMDYLSDEGSVTKQELQEFIDMTKYSDVNYEQQDFLWGTEMVVKSNAREKAKLTAKVKQAINSEKSVYAKVVAAKNEKMLSGKGNTLNSEANKEQLDLLKDVSGIIDFGKNRQNDPINATLNKYANEIQNGMKVAKAVELAIGEITETVQSGDYLKLAMEGTKETNTNEQIGMGEIINERIETIPRDNETVNQGSEREEPIEGQFDFFGTQENTVAETKEKLVANNMAFDKDDYIESDAEVSEVNYAMSGLDLLDGFKESQTKKTVMEGKGSDRIKQTLEDEDPFYKTITIAGEMFRSKQQVEGRVESELVRLETMLSEKKEFTAQDGTDIQAVFDAVDELLNETGDSYWNERAKRINKVRKNVLSNAGQLLVTGKAMKKASPRMTLIGFENDVEVGMTPAEKKNADNVERGAGKLLVDIPEINGKIQLKQDEADAFIKLVMDRFPKLKKKWGKMWTKELVYGATTKAEIMDSIYTALQIPHLGVQTRADILENLEAMTKLKEETPEFNIHNNNVKSIIRRSHGISIWTKVSALQTYAMLGNAKTGIKNELGNWIGFSMGQLDSRFAHILDKSYAKKTGVITTAQKGNLGGYVKGYKEGVKLSLSDLKNKTDSRSNTSKYFDTNQGSIFEHEKGGYARILVDLVSGENVVEAAKQFAEHTAAKSENLTKFIVDDRRHGFARYEMAFAAIEATDIQIKELNKTLPKDKQIVFSAEELKAKIDLDIAYYTFNNKTEGALILKNAVQWLNKVSTRGATTEFGAGTLIAKYTQTPMNIIAFTSDHLGGDYSKKKLAYNRDYKALLKTMPKVEAKREALTQHQQELATSKAKAFTGLSFVTAGAILSLLGGITPDNDDDPDRLIAEAQGYKGSYFNLSGLVRNTFGLGSDEGQIYDYGTGDVRGGDTLTSINQLAPGGAFLLLGARIFSNLTNEEADKTLMSMVSNTAQGFIDSSTDLVDLPFNRTAQLIINGFKYARDTESVTEALGNVGNQLLGSAITSFYPAVVKQTAQYLDPFAKTYSKDSGTALREQIMASTPTMRDNVPYAFTINGEPIQYSGEKNSIEALWSAYVAPYYKSVARYDKTTTKLAKQVKSKAIAPPRLAPNKFSYNSTDHVLTKPERQAFQKVYWENYRLTKDVDSAYETAKIDYLQSKKIPYTTSIKTGKLTNPKKK